jgi:hypothetical protein
MERKDRRRLRESGIPLDFSEPAAMFALGTGSSDVEPMGLIPREDWPKEISAMAAEEAEFWAGGYISVRLMVELPFWLMTPDCEIPISHKHAKIQVRIRGDYAAIADGPEFLDSQQNVIFVAPKTDLTSNKRPPPQVASSRAPVVHPMKTVLIFEVEAIEDAVKAIQTPPPETPWERTQIRRVNRAIQYFQSLAYAHLPFVNHLITSYRVASGDPFAYQISTWDVPAWFVEWNHEFVPICLMPYWGVDRYPTLRTSDEREPSPIYAASSEAVESQSRTDVAPGILELLDARSLLYRGHFEDAVRSSVTAVEIAMEAQITKLLADKGWPDERIRERLAETWNDFDKRVADYERISETRIPGPILSELPYINGIRLKSELSRVRKLRHKIVHEGLRVDFHTRGPMIRAIETMMWLFHWLTWEEGKAEEKSKSYVFCEMMRGLGIPRYTPEYRESGVVVFA